MKKLYILLYILLLCISAKGQTTIRERKTVQVLTPQTFYLNGGNRAALGGKSRTWYPIQLPSNTIEWYYSFTTTKGEDPTPSIKLMSQLTKLVDPTGLTAITTNAILTPSGAAMCDIYLMDRPNADKFLEKVDNWGGTVMHKVSAFRENYKDGTVQINDITSGIWYLGFKNPSAVQGISITIEVVAIVEEIKIKEKTELETKAEMFAEMGWKAYERGEYEKCMELSKKSLEFNSNLGWVYNNIGLVYLIKKDYISAIDSYSNAISYFKRDKANTKQWFTEAIKDLNALLVKHGQLEGAKDILDMLYAEQRK